jgi:hypothetical protein
MPVALATAGLPSQPRQGVGAPLIRRLGGAVRSVIGSGINLAAALRRPAVPQTGRNHAAAQDPQASASSRVPLQRPLPASSTSPALRGTSPAKRAAEGAAPLPPPWLALLLARRHGRPAATRRPAFLNQGDIHFTPQAFPQLSPKACAVLNTPVKDCDPKTLKLLVSAFTQHINQVMSPEAGITDPNAFPNLLHRLSTALDDAKADTPAPATPEAVPTTPPAAVPNAPAASPHPPVQAPPTAPATQWTNLAPRAPLPLSGLPASDHQADATITTAAPQAPPDIPAPSGPVPHQSRSFRSDRKPFPPRRRSPFHRCRALLPQSLRDGPQCLPPPHRLYYAACTGPP